MKRVLFYSAAAIATAAGLSSYKIATNHKNAATTYWFSTGAGTLSGSVPTSESSIEQSQLVLPAEVVTSNPDPRGCGGTAHYCAIELTASQVNLNSAGTKVTSLKSSTEPIQSSETKM